MTFSQMMRDGLDELESNFDAMVIGNQGENFSVGANLMMVLLAAQEQEWDELNAAINRFQQINMALKYAPKPVVAAPVRHGARRRLRNLPLHCARMQASAETLHGPGGSGRGRDSGRRRLQGDCCCVRAMSARFSSRSVSPKYRAAPPKRGSFGFLRDGDGVSMNPERLIDDAKNLALSLVPGYAPGAPRTDIKVVGRRRLRADEDGRLDGAARRLHLAITMRWSERSWRTCWRRPAHRHACRFPNSICSIWNAKRFSASAAARKRSSVCSTCSRPASRCAIRQAFQNA